VCHKSCKWGRLRSSLTCLLSAPRFWSAGGWAIDGCGWTATWFCCPQRAAAFVERQPWLRPSPYSGGALEIDIGVDQAVVSRTWTSSARTPRSEFATKQAFSVRSKSSCALAWSVFGLTVNVACVVYRTNWVTPETRSSVPSTWASSLTQSK
jgi:hypothetical protein